MIDLHFHWAWIFISIVVLVGVCWAMYLFSKTEETWGYSFFMGVIVLIFAALIAAAFGGVFLW